jgi:hypothetical protein
MKARELLFNIGDKVIKFSVEDFDDIDIDKILKIDYANILAEIITFPLVVNKFGLLAADMDNEFQMAKLDLSIYEAKRKNQLREELLEENGKKPTVDEVESALLTDKVWKVKRVKMHRIQKEKEYMYSIYTSAKDKSTKLDKLSMTLRPGDVDLDLIQKQMNNVYFKIKDARFK